MKVTMAVIWLLILVILASAAANAAAMMSQDEMQGLAGGCTKFYCKDVRPCSYGTPCAGTGTTCYNCGNEYIGGYIAYQMNKACATWSGASWRKCKTIMITNGCGWIVRGECIAITTGISCNSNGSHTSNRGCGDKSDCDGG